VTLQQIAFAFWNLTVEVLWWMTIHNEKTTESDFLISRCRLWNVKVDNPSCALLEHNTQTYIHI